jgi:hypothetical protein
MAMIRSISRPSRGRQQLIAAIGAIAMVLALIGGVTAWFSSRAEDPSAAYQDAAAAAAAAGDAVAARVNGVEILQGEVDSLRVSAGVFPVNGVEPASAASILDYLIRNELLRQEAERRGLVASDDEVSALIAEQQKLLMDQRDVGTAPPQILNMLKGLASIGHPIEDWISDPAIREMYRSLIVRSKLAQEETKDIPIESNGRDKLIQERMDQLAAKLGSEATIQILTK